jgi:carbonic anhydrase
MKTYSLITALLLAAGMTIPTGATPPDATHAPAKPKTTVRTTKPVAKTEPRVEPKPATTEAGHDSTTTTEPSPAAAHPASEGDAATADEAIRRLTEGNARWVSGKSTSPHTDAAWRRETAENGQKPFASILTCADSRLPVERVFDQGAGDVFVMRVAGNVSGPHEAGSIEYGAEHLHTPVLVVLGHTQCGAVKAAVGGGHVGGNIDSLLTPIAPAVDRARKLNPGVTEGELLSASVRENVWQSIFDLLKSSDTCRELVHEGKLTVVGAVYDISSGKVEWLGEHPWQAELVAAFVAREQHAEATAE